MVFHFYTDLSRHQDNWIASAPNGDRYVINICLPINSDATKDGKICGGNFYYFVCFIDIYIYIIPYIDKYSTVYQFPQRLIFIQK